MNEPCRLRSDDLRTFLAVADCEQVTAAADQLRLSQPAVTRALGRLEGEFQVQLFDRPGRRVKLNIYGRTLAAYAQRVVVQLDAAQAELHALSDRRGGPVRIGFLPSLGTWMIPNLIREFRIAEPDASFVLRQATSDLLPGLLDEREVDLLFTSQRPHLSEPVAWRVLLQERLELAVPPDHRLAKRKSAYLSEVSRDPFVFLGADSGLRQISDQLCLQAGFQPVVAFESGELATVRALVTAGLGVGILPVLRQPAEPGSAHQLKLTDLNAHWPLGMAWCSSHRITGASEAFRCWLLSQAQTSPWEALPDRPQTKLPAS
jgi:DNA-binding transcriptional LysR family regulator